MNEQRTRAVPASAEIDEFADHFGTRRDQARPRLGDVVEAETAVIPERHGGRFLRRRLE